MIKVIDRYEDVIDFAWELSQNDMCASYPRRKIRKEMKDDILNAIHADNKNILACYYQDVLCGLCIYFWDRDEKYAQTTEFLIREHYDQAADEFIGYISNQLEGYELFIGVPFTNTNAIQYFNRKNIEWIESSIDTRLFNLKPQEAEKHNQVESITKNNFDEYRIFHDKYALPLGMYYNSKNICKDIDRFRIFAFRQDKQIHGSIFVKIFKDIAEGFQLPLSSFYSYYGKFYLFILFNMV